MKYIEIIKNGFLKENPIFVLLLGMCPTLATTTSAMNGLSMGLATTFVLICSNVVISCIKNVTPDKVRIPVFIVVIASFVTVPITTWTIAATRSRATSSCSFWAWHALWRCPNRREAPSMSAMLRCGLSQSSTCETCWCRKARRGRWRRSSMTSGGTLRF